MISVLFDSNCLFDLSNAAVIVLYFSFTSRNLFFNSSLFIDCETVESCFCIVLICTVIHTASITQVHPINICFTLCCFNFMPTSFLFFYVFYFYVIVLLSCLFFLCYYFVFAFYRAFFFYSIDVLFYTFCLKYGCFLFKSMFTKISPSLPFSFSRIAFI